MDFETYVKESLTEIKDDIKYILGEMKKINDKTNKNCNEISVLQEKTKNLDVLKVISGIVSGVIALMVSSIFAAVNFMRGGR